ncbi:MAG TPA: hypothetical protein VHM70_07110, partial [Polyangiaceae bacterium]|nr:hypothetical protein [Polyangiaceae bacterium]
MMMFCRVFALVSAVLFVAACDGSFGPFEPVDIAVESSFAEADGPVAVAGDYAAVVGTVGTQRAVDLYVRKVSGWQKLQRLSARSPKRVDPWDFGNAVSMVGRYLAVSGRSNKGGPEGHGYADIYERTDGVYVFQRSVTATESHVYPTDHPTFGDRLACFGQRLLVGVRRDLGYRGRAYLFNLSTGAREAEFNVPAIDPLAAYNQFGSAVALSSDRVVIGQDYEYATCPRTPCPSPVYVFRRDSSGA